MIEPVAQTDLKQANTDFRNIFAAETEKFTADSARFDPAKDALEQNKQQTKRKWTKKDTVILTAAVIVVAAIVFFVVKYGKDCKSSSPAGCITGVDEPCMRRVRAA